MGSGQQAEPLKGLAAGLVAGFVATFAMTQFQNAWTKISASVETEQEHSGKESAHEENSTVKVARMLSRSVLGHDLAPQERQTAGTLVHYGFGTLMGGVYGVNAELFPHIARAGFGTLHGLGLWLGADEIGLWQLGFAGAPSEFPLKTHVYAAASHIVYGIVTEGARRLLRG